MKAATGVIYAATDGRNTFTVTGPEPTPGNELCRALTGSTEAELVRRILAGEFNGIINNRECGKIGGKFHED